jgi:hypothetical protein
VGLPLLLLRLPPLPLLLLCSCLLLLRVGTTLGKLCHNMPAADWLTVHLPPQDG